MTPRANTFRGPPHQFCEPHKCHKDEYQHLCPNCLKMIWSSDCHMHCMPPAIYTTHHSDHHPERPAIL